MNAADRETEAHALGFESAQDKIDYERKMLGDRFDIVPRLRAHQWKGFDETNTNLNDAADIIAALLTAIRYEERLHAQTKNALEVQKTITGAQAMLIEDLRREDKR